MKIFGKFFWKKKSSFWQFFDIQMAIFRRVSCWGTHVRGQERHDDRGQKTWQGGHCVRHSEQRTCGTNHNIIWQRGYCFRHSKQCTHWPNQNIIWSVATVFVNPNSLPVVKNKTLFGRVLLYSWLRTAYLLYKSKHCVAAWLLCSSLRTT